VRRREFITLLGGTVAAWPLAARAQQDGILKIGFLDSGSAAQLGYRLVAFLDGLKESGFVGGRNVSIEYRWAQGQYERLPVLAAELVRLPVALIAATGSPNSAKAAGKATTTIPVVFVNGGDPVELGLVTSINRPSGNVTGVTFFHGGLVAKRLEVLRELIPTAALVAVLVNPKNPNTEPAIAALKSAGRTLGLELIFLNASNDADFDNAFTAVVQQRAAALYVGPDTFFSSRREQIVALAVRHSIPTSHTAREYVLAGGLVSYGTSVSDAFRKGGAYAGRILKGEKPADLPVEQPTKFELVLNLKTAKTLGLEIPPMLLARADEVIE
jgi:putative ABC transport system substrate-binding protein